MTDNVIHLSFSNPGVKLEDHSLLACQHCRNKTFKLVYFIGNFPLLQCCACDAHIGRIGWAPNDAS
jgi:hypothetical protein